MKYFRKEKKELYTFCFNYWSVLVSWRCFVALVICPFGSIWDNNSSPKWGALVLVAGILFKELTLEIKIGDVNHAPKQLRKNMEEPNSQCIFLKRFQELEQPWQKDQSKPEYIQWKHAWKRKRKDSTPKLLPKVKMSRLESYLFLKYLHKCFYNQPSKRIQWESHWKSKMGFGRTKH